jgi:Cu-Zn family superoxide dismutase
MNAIAEVTGGPLAPEVSGSVLFKDIAGGTEVIEEIKGLPSYRPAQNGEDPIGPHGFHIHECGNCAGYALIAFFTNRFKPQDIVDKAVIIHLNPDDYRTQPAGNAGKRVACGVIKWSQHQ